MFARIDAAQTNNENRRYWANTDSYGPNACFDTTTRQIVRDRSRYEDLNDSYYHGLLRSLCYDLIGTGPRLQLNIPGKTAAAKDIQRKYKSWCRATGIGAKFRLMVKSADVAGDVFGIHDTNERVRHTVKLDIRLAEAEMCETPFEKLSTPNIFDGVEIDAFGQPVQYYFNREHPGETKQPFRTSKQEYIPIKAERVCHWFERTRPNQLRGIPKMTCSLPQWARRRRFAEATIIAAEVAATMAGVLESSLPPIDGGPTTVASFDVFEMVRGMLLTLPLGWKMNQFKPEHPTTNFPDYNRENLNEAGRGAGAPLNVTSGNSSGYNYSSGRLDHVPYHRGIRIDRSDFAHYVIDPTFLAWVDEASMISGYIESDLPEIDEWAWSWNWDGFDSIDPKKDAETDKIRLESGTATLAEILAEYGQDVEEFLDEMVRERELCKERNLPWPLTFAAPKSAAPPDEEEEEDDDREEEDKLAARFHMNGHLNGYAGGVH